MTIYRGPGGTGEARTDSDVTEVRIIADEAEGYKDQAATSASAAASSASAAATAETNAETAEANAETAEANAEAAQAAAEAAQAAAEAAQTAAEAAQTAAELAETNAETAEANAETAEANAETAQAAAATSATNAAASASTATTQASNAASSASTATTQAGIATTKANEAASSATAAQSAQTAAESARDSALSAYDNFDDRYLGPKSSDPTLDNDGNALLTGALYYDTTSSVMKVYTGSSWVAAYVSAAGTLLAANNLSDLVSVSTARTNLGLGTAALVADSTLVHKTGDETIAGTKTFSSTITGSVSGNAATATTATNVSGGTASVTTLTTSSTVTHNGGTANGVAYLNGSKVLTTGSALTFDGTSLTNASLIGNPELALANSQTPILSLIGGTGSIPVIAYKDVGLRFGSATGTGAAGFSEQMRLTSTGLGIGTSSPVSKLHIESTSAESFQIGYSSTKRGRIGATSAGDLQVYAYETGVGYRNILLATDAGSAAGNVGIGTSSPTNKLTVSGTGTVGRLISSNTGVYLGLQTSDANGVYLGSVSNSMVFQTNDTERARIDSSGNLLVGTTTVGGNGGITLAPNADDGAGRITFDRATTTASSIAIVFENAGTTSGQISYTNTATTYSTSSDYRLKENIAPMTGALAKVAALKPCTYKWKADGSDGEGFIAHELAEVAPQCVTGEKDAVDADGNPQYQGIDTSFLVATLTAAIQEQQAIITAQQAALTALTARVTALESN